MRRFSVSILARFLGLISVISALGAATLCRADNITYNISLIVGNATVIGTITTDGKIGVLNPDGMPSDIVTWNLSLNDPTNYAGQPVVPCDGGPCAVNLTGPNGVVGVDGPQIDTVSGTDLSATPTQLLFNFNGTDGGFFLVETGNYGAVCFETTFNCIANSFGAGVSLYIDPQFDFDSDNQYTPVMGAGAEVIGAVPPLTETPEPPVFALLLTGIAMLSLYQGRAQGTRKALPH